jgi:lysophospholipase L1-like esterase
VNDIEEITKKINKKLPNCKIYVESIYPINSDWKEKHNSNVPEIDEIKPKIIETNNRLKKICKDNNYEYLDIFKLLRTDEDLLDSDYTDDGLHPNDQAYIIISDYLKAILFEKSE